MAFERSSFKTLAGSLIATAILLNLAIAATPDSERLHGTLVVAVPVQEGLVACADKRLFNIDAGTFNDNNVKIRKVADKMLFAATSTVGFYDRKNKKMAFDAFEVTANYATKNSFSEGREFWDGLRAELRNELLNYLAARKFSEWPETDKANQNLLFNLVFYSIENGHARSHTLKVFYEKKRTPVVSVSDPVSEEVRFPKLSGKGRDVMAYISHDPSLAADPSILRFDETRFDILHTSVQDAVDFSRKLFEITNEKLPKAQVSSTFDCALLSYQQGFRWLEGGSAHTSSSAMNF